MRHAAEGSYKGVDIKIHWKRWLNYLGVTLPRETNISSHNIISKLCYFQVLYMDIHMYTHIYIWTEIHVCKIDIHIYKQKERTGREESYIVIKSLYLPGNSIYYM